VSIFQYAFMRHAMEAGLLVSIACGIIGSYVVVKKMAFMAGGVAHISFGGIGLGYFLGFNPLLTALVFTTASAIGIGFSTKKSRLSEDTLVGVFWASGMALGALFIALTPGYPPDLFSYLFGDILVVSPTDLILMLVIDVVIVLVVSLLYKELLAVAFDEEFAQVRGVPAGALYLLLLALIAFTVIALIRAVGIILVIALLTIPAAMARQYVRSLKGMMVLSTVFGALFIFAGLFLSYVLNLSFEVRLSSGATIVLLGALSFFITRAIRSFRRRSGAISRPGTA